MLNETDPQSTIKTGGESTEERDWTSQNCVSKEEGHTFFPDTKIEAQDCCKSFFH